MNYLKDKSNLYYVVYLVIIINFLVNFYNSYKNSTYSNFNFYDLASSLLLFLCLLLMGVFIKEILGLPYISTGIITYLLSFFVSDNIILFLYRFTDFSIIYYCEYFLVIYSCFKAKI